MTYKENITAILECYFTGFKKEIIDSACNRILEQEPSGDLISRDGTLTAFADYVGSGMSMDDFDALWDIVAKMPTVTPKPKTGHWIEGEVWEDTDGGWGRWQKCSICRQSEHHKKNFCPNCGAKMIESQESEDKE